MKDEHAGHTPGPWKIQDEYDGTLPIDGWSEQADSIVEICRVSLDMLDKKERAANAALIAAAPEMTAKIERLEDINKELLAALDNARAALAKAKGK